jgi:hypothetical protein
LGALVETDLLVHILHVRDNNCLLLGSKITCVAPNCTILFDVVSLQNNLHFSSQIILSTFSLLVVFKTEMDEENQLTGIKNRAKGQQKLIAKELDCDL